MRLVDAHVHLDLYPDPAAAVDACEAAGVYAICMTTTPKAWKGTSSLVSHARRIRCAIGLHPQVAAERRAEVELGISLMTETAYVGEIGLDGTMPPATHPVQRTVFRRMLEGATSSGGRVVSVHSRRAVDDVLSLLRRYTDKNLVILHWFTGTPRQLRQAIELGCWFSVGPAMTSTTRGRSLASSMPPERVLTESDGPFGKLRGKSLMPGDVGVCYDHLASCWEVSQEEVENTVMENFVRLGAGAQAFLNANGAGK